VLAYVYKSNYGLTTIDFQSLLYLKRTTEKGIRHFTRDFKRKSLKASWRRQKTII